MGYQSFEMKVLRLYEQPTTRAPHNTDCHAKLFTHLAHQRLEITTSNLVSRGLQLPGHCTRLIDLLDGIEISQQDTVIDLSSESTCICLCSIKAPDGIFCLWETLPCLAAAVCWGRASRTLCLLDPVSSHGTTASSEVLSWVCAICWGSHMQSQQSGTASSSRCLFSNGGHLDRHAKLCATAVWQHIMWRSRSCCKVDSREGCGGEQWTSTTHRVSHQDRSPSNHTVDFAVECEQTLRDNARRYCLKATY